MNGPRKDQTSERGPRQANPSASGQTPWPAHFDPVADEFFYARCSSTLPDSRKYTYKFDFIYEAALTNNLPLLM